MHGAAIHLRLSNMVRMAGGRASGLSASADGKASERTPYESMSYITKKGGHTMNHKFVADELETKVDAYTDILNPSGYDSHVFIMSLRDLVDKLRFASKASTPESE
jgi:hypothetical protein